MIKYYFGKLSVSKVLDFLIQTDCEFPYPLSSRVNINKYAIKLSDFSHFSYCMDDGIIVGMISCYINNPPMGFISNVCVKSKYQGLGIFSKMLEVLIQSVQDFGICYLRLEVDNNNIAQQVYLRKKFVMKEAASDHSTYMEYVIRHYER